ncbi:MFS general substrate transporter [Tuber magnatum]|uniref:MFS general substrate transporter n=1 Tax=Tuber magnatum TaxID=42249 RepID=A0A317T1K5_9PEZI|nr:MFS general substrate transporter [Tuber magnatum]
MTNIPIPGFGFTRAPPEAGFLGDGLDIGDEFTSERIMSAWSFILLADDGYYNREYLGVSGRMNLNTPLPTDIALLSFEQFRSGNWSFNRRTGAQHPRQTVYSEEAYGYKLRPLSFQLQPERASALTRAFSAVSRISRGLSGDYGPPRTIGDLENVLDTHYEVKWDGLQDQKNPVNWSLPRKIVILFLISMQYLMVVFYSTSYVSGTRGMMEEFDIPNRTSVSLGLTTYQIGLALGPLLLAPMSELFGRRPVYQVSMGLFCMLLLPACFAKNLEGILVSRFFAALAGSVTLSNSAGSLADLFSEKSKALAFNIFMIAPLEGPIIGPLLGGFIYERLGWKYLNYLTLIFSTTLAIAGYFIPETYTPVLMRKKAAMLRKTKGDEKYMSRYCYKVGEGGMMTLVKLNMKRPLLMLFTEPICVFWALYIGVQYGILYLSFTAYPIVFQEIRGWTPGIAGLSFLGLGLGIIIAVFTEPLNNKLVSLHKPDPETSLPKPESKILIVCLAGILSPISLFMFAWTCSPTSIHPIWPILSGVPFGISNTLIFMHGNAYLLSSYDLFAASCLAGCAVFRSILCGLLPLVGPKLYQDLGANMAMTVVGILAAALAPIPWAFYKWGKWVRARSPILVGMQAEKEYRERQFAVDG